MGKLIYIMGKSGTGKSRSMKNIPANTFGLVNLEGKDLPFGKNSPAFGVETVSVDTVDDILDAIRKFSRKYKIIVVDDFQTLMTNEFMRRTREVGYQKWNDIGQHAWQVAEIAKELPSDCCLYVLCHTEENENGGEKIKTLGKLLDQYVVLESKSTVVLKTAVIDGKYYFLTQNSGNDTVKSPEEMFPSYAIDNDLQYVDDKIRNYYGLAGSKSDAELQAADNEHSTTIQKPTETKRVRRSKDTAEKPAEPTRGEVKVANAKKEEQYEQQKREAVEQALATAEPDNTGAVSYDVMIEAEESVPKPQLDPLPARTRRTRAPAASPVNKSSKQEPEQPAADQSDAAPKQRTRRIRNKPEQQTITASEFEEILSDDGVPF